MNQPTDLNSRQTLENALSCPQDGLEDASGTREASEGENGAQSGADSLGLHELITRTLTHCPDTSTWDAMASAVVDAITPRLAGHYSRAVDAAVAAERRAEQAEAKLGRVQRLAEEYPAGIDTALIEEALDDPQPAHDAGPSVRECAAADRRWWDSEKTGER